MGKYFLRGIIAFSLLLTLVGCQKNIRPIKTETIDFDLNVAQSMIEVGERKIIDLLQDTVISKNEYDLFFKEMENQYGHRAQDFKFFFNTIETENPNTLKFTLQDNVFYPTSLHKDIQLTSAQVRKKTFKDTFFNTEYLTITIEYVGEDPYMKDFYREYLYNKAPDDDWNFYGFNGTSNYSGEGLSPTYLDLK